MSKSRVLIIIPAYNEAENIGPVLDSLKKEVSFADLVVVNDHSSDDTKTIVEKAGVNCVTNIFNMGYAWAIQTGIKYAKLNDYDFAIFMDADGQHLASEAIKLHDAIVKTNSDIVIGSRYLKKTGYKCPLFRRIGTKFFEIIIRLFTGKRIADPLSGFQCINKKVIDFWAGCGNYPEYPDASLLIEMILRGYKITEISVKMKNRESGASMHSGIWKPIKYMTTQFYTCIVTLVKYIGKRRIK